MAKKNNGEALVSAVLTLGVVGAVAGTAYAMNKANSKKDAVIILLLILGVIPVAVIASKVYVSSQSTGGCFAVILTYAVIASYLGYCIVASSICSLSYLEYDIDIDISRKRLPDHYEYIYSNMVNIGIAQFIEIYNNQINRWKHECEKRIHKAFIFTHRRIREYKELAQKIDGDYEIFYFRFYRTHKKYYQRNCVRHSYYGDDIEAEYHYSLNEISNILCK